MEMFNAVIRRDIEKEALENFDLAKKELENGTRLENHKVFILSFEGKKSQ
jgi:hypothetical protein